MSIKSLLIEATARDIRITRFLATKLPADKADWRPTPGQRSALELLQYLTSCGYVPALWLSTGNEELVKPLREERSKVTLATFDAAMARQGERLAKLIQDTPEADFDSKKVKLFWGDEVTLGEMFMEISVKFLAAYRMQFFLYLKQMGVEGLGTSHVWAGREPAPQPAK
jgi:hypothetical protein